MEAHTQSETQVQCLLDNLKKNIDKFNPVQNVCSVKKKKKLSQRVNKFKLTK